MEQKTLYIIIPAYNEQDNIRDVIEDWYPVIEQYGSEKSRLVVIDDGSTDHTYHILQECVDTRPRLQPIQKANSGHGATVLYGYRYALDHGADYIFQTDSDRQTNPEEFGAFWALREQYDMVIGYRSHREDGYSRIVVTKALKLIIQICFGVTVTDANTPFRLMGRDTLEENLKYVPEDFNLSNVILSVAYAKTGQKVKFLPITFRPRQGGVNSIHLNQIIHIGIRAWKDFRNINAAMEGIHHTDHQSIQLLKRILYCSDGCSLCRNRERLGGGYWDCKINCQDNCGGRYLSIDWDAAWKEYINNNSK